MNKVLFLMLFLCISHISMGQDMKEGFNHLENGAYDKAKVFFQNILQEYPDNRTAKLCYGRAIGLLGESKKAVAIFTELKTMYPDDYEIKLNYAESLLWDKNFNAAETYYERIVKEKPNSFAAVLGYANTLSNLKKYPSALETVNKALEIQVGNNNALVSRKYIRLGYAFTLSQNKEYDKALTLLDQNLEDFPDDKDTLLNKANIYLVINQYADAEEMYYKTAKNRKDSIISLQGLSLVAHKMHKEKKALDLAKESLKKAKTLESDNEILLSSYERYVQALFWNRKFKDAKTSIDELKNKYPGNSKLSSLQATYGMYTSDFGMSLDQYSTILDSDKSSFDGNLGIANAYRASGLDMKAYEFAFKTLSYYPKQSDAEKLISDLKISHTPFVENKTAFTFDNGDNEAISTSFNTEIPLSTKLKIKGSYSFRSTENTRTNIKAESQEASIGLDYKFSGKISLKTSLGLNNSNAETDSYSGIIAEVTLSTKPFKLQSLDIGYKREFQNFNADLIDREIVMNNYSINYNLGTNFNLGWYTQAIYTSQSDDNSRNLLFTSLYYNVLNRPVLKVGLNYQYISFKNQVPTIYFSPSSFNLVEIFAEILNNQNNDWFYSLSAALGRQFVEEDPASTTFRAEGKIGHHFSKRFTANFYGKYSNIASATAAGFEFTEIGFRLKWYFLKKPIFNKKIEKLRL
ncbi:Tetratricopeptide repeat-containing protein [Aquimarina amphilecti]|uniref:Tetratricopeptide repeat-containing protein n=1 Tax=Aquimarina amphilecti TaxID=1038014 RepID=A0A1H7S1M2_AQUAM|nr:tetratricopeptide repeat protein [Aquimarina amphilecti]SEL66403.1 Tetratricopeptide repeat-containing protein [Aquimarina amphilecti]